MTIEEMIQLEPRLKLVEKYVKDYNRIAAETPIYWYKLWSEARKKLYPLIGWGAQEKQLQNSQVWDSFHDHLKSLAKYTR